MESSGRRSLLNGSKTLVFSMVLDRFGSETVDFCGDFGPSKLFSSGRSRWENWSKKIGNFDIPKDAEAHALIVPTSDTARRGL